VSFSAHLLDIATRAQTGATVTAEELTLLRSMSDGDRAQLVAQVERSPRSDADRARHAAWSALPLDERLLIARCDPPGEQTDRGRRAVSDLLALRRERAGGAPPKWWSEDWRP